MSYAAAHLAGWSGSARARIEVGEVVLGEGGAFGDGLWPSPPTLGDGLLSGFMHSESSEIFFVTLASEFLCLMMR